jgi:hypothetical protein
MSLITTAGLESVFADKPDPLLRRKENIKSIREKLRNPQATDDDWDEALDALIEATKD